MKTRRADACYYCTTGLLAIAMMGMPAVVHALPSSDTAPLDTCSADGTLDYSYPLHIAAVFIIMGTSALGVFIPVLAVQYPVLRIPDWLVTLGKHFGTGVILATGFIHMLPSAMTNLTSPCLSSAWNSDYPVYAALFAMLAALLMQLTEQLASENAEKRRREHAAKDARKLENSTAGVAAPTPIISERLSANSNPASADGRKTSSHPHHHTSLEDEADLTSVIVNSNDNSNDNTVHSIASTEFSSPVAPLTDPSSSPKSLQEGVSFNVSDMTTELAVSHLHSHHTHTHSHVNDHYPHHHHHHHEHPFGSHDHAHGILFLENERKKTSTYILELGITSHSVIIGVALGVSNGGEFMGLLVALIFHQFFEGFALGARISEIYSGSRLATVMSLIFALTTPLGIGIGIGISSSYNPNSTAALLAQGIFDSVSAGILLYMAFVNLIAVEFTQNLKLVELKTSTKVSYYLAMYGGAGIMALIGRWA